jgi:branched-subunit amino acid aminotransferase/4-amino-4-deoxychorismate lyase
LITLLEPYRPDEARVRVMMTQQGQVYIAIEPLKPLPHEFYENGVRVKTTEVQRHNPRLKSTAFIGASAVERKHIARKGIFEALLVKNGRILEGMTSNFFYVTSRAPKEHWDYSEQSDERSLRSPDEARSFLQSRASSSLHSAQREVLYTAQRNVLLGVTRRTIIHLAPSSSRGVVPVVQIDGVMVGQGRPGPITRMLMSAYDQYVLEHAEKI